MISSASPCGIHLRYRPENDFLYNTSFIKEYLSTQAFTLIASVLLSGKALLFRYSERGVIHDGLARLSDQL